MRAMIIAAGLLAATAAFSQAPQTATPAPRTAPASAASPSAGKALIDINSASPAELQTLKGVGDARAEAIVKGRPYKGKDDLVHKKILSQAVYDGVKDQIVARQK